MRFRRWLQPGMGVKRWLLLVFAGMLLLALGSAHVIRQVTQDFHPGGAVQAVVDVVTLQFLPFPLRGFIAAVAGVSLIWSGRGGWPSR